MRSIAGPGVLVGEPDAALHAEGADDGEDDVLRVDAGLEGAAHHDAPHFSGSMARHCDASTSLTCEVPMPNATAPNAPCVDVWLSPQAIVIPGCVRPSSGPMTWTMPCSSLSRPNSGTPKLAAIPLERRHHLLRHAVGEGTRLPVGRHDVIDRRERAVRKGDALAAEPEHVERLRARHFVHEVQADE